MSAHAQPDAHNPLPKTTPPSHACAAVHRAGCTPSCQSPVTAWLNHTASLLQASQPISPAAMPACVPASDVYHSHSQHLHTTSDAPTHSQHLHTTNNAPNHTPSRIQAGTDPRASCKRKSTATWHRGQITLGRGCQARAHRIPKLANLSGCERTLCCRFHKPWQTTARHPVLQHTLGKDFKCCHRLCMHARYRTRCVMQSSHTHTPGGHSVPPRTHKLAAAASPAAAGREATPFGSQLTCRAGSHPSVLPAHDQV